MTKGEASWEPPWGREGWPEVPEGSRLDEADRELLRRRLKMTPWERLVALEELVDDLQEARSGLEVSSD